MHYVRKITDDLLMVGGNDRRIALFENVYPVPDGVSYNSYLLLDEKTVLFDTVTKRSATCSWKIWNTRLAEESWIIWWSVTWNRITARFLRTCTGCIRK